MQETIENKAEALTEKSSGCRHMFIEKEIDKLALMYQIFSRVPSTLKYIINKMNPYIMEEGRKILKNEDNLGSPIKFTEKLLKFKEEIDELIAKSFQNDMKF